jgi:hypothetical protein
VHPFSQGAESDQSFERGFSFFSSRHFSSSSPLPLYLLRRDDDMETQHIQEVPPEFRQPRIHPLSDAVPPEPESWLHASLPEGYQEFLDLLKEIKDGWKHAAQQPMWNTDRWEKHWIGIISPTMWFRWLESRSSAPSLVKYVLKKHLNKENVGYLTSDILNRNFVSLDLV